MRLAEQLWNEIGVLDRDSVQFICIGTLKVNGDSVAPLVGTLLSRKGYDVIGTDTCTFNGANIGNRINELDPRKIHIAVDCTVLNRNSERFLYESYVNVGGIYPGSGLGKELGCVGDYGVHVPMTFDCGSSSLTLLSLADVTMDVVHRVAGTVVDEIELYFGWCDAAIASSDDVLGV